jgi:PAS domain S-box-containing protein
VEEAQTASAKFKAVFEQSSVFAGIMTLEGTVIEANWLCLEVCGYRAEDVIGKPFWECGWWRGSKEVQEKLRVGTVRAAGGTAYAETLPYLWADGTQRVVEFGLHPIRDDAGHVIYLHPTGVDVTDRQKAEARAEFLIRLTQKLSIVSDPSEINRIATREIGQFLGADRCYFCLATPDPETMEVLPDWHRDGDVGFEGVHPLAEFGQPELWQKMRAHAVSVDDVRTHPLTKDFLSNYQRVNILAFNQAPFVHEGRWVACVAVSAIQPRQWTANEMALLENAVARVWPLIERARVESALREANALLADKAAHLEALVQQRTAKLRETIGELESFSYSIAHDLRSPLRSLQGFSDILLTDYGPKLGSECQRFLQLIAAAASRMDRLIQDVLSYSQVVRAEWPLETVDVGQLLREIVETYPMFAPDKAEILFQGPFPRVLGGEALLTQVFSNLLGNAVKFVAPGVKPQLKVWAERKGGWVRLLVRDNGIGIAADQHEKIFAIFQRANKAYEGTGIGLAIVKKAVERLGGKVGLQSELGRGSTFWVEVKQAPDTRYPGKDTNVVPH